MGIELGLSRIILLLKRLNNPHLTTWKAVHVSGTNGKGSICSYISSILQSSSISSGKFTSPHLLSVTDSIMVNGKPLTKDSYERIKRKVKDVDHQFAINATEFEVLTAVAFEAFREMRVKVAVIEVGLGGRYDSTNVLTANSDTLKDKANDQGDYGVLVTGVANISKDHENVLGNTIEAIAYQKAGIIKPQVPCVVDGTNSGSVIEVIREEAKLKNSQLTVADATNKQFLVDSHSGRTTTIDATSLSPLLGSYQAANLSVAFNIITQVRRQLSHSKNPETRALAQKITLTSIIKGIKDTKWPGRLQKLQLRNTTQSKLDILLDGAHNVAAAHELQKYLQSSISSKRKVALVVSMTASKDLPGVMAPILDSIKEVSSEFAIYLTNFDHTHGVEDMPWIKSYDCDLMKSEFEALGVDTTNINIQKDVAKLFGKVLPEKMGGNQEDWDIVVCGSLYLVSEVLRIHLANGGDIKDIY
ncbi:dihydrofolate synthase [Saccharomycopsis crataegensis]|uniref:Dihydrofolate synthase n=1 Tax=Saccharomycopsis crataegensis TaxID=43959 RepID=A0AAV5QSV3_9ASCO|nr:dihydrofolate synthase [Saccharomycopsis crataegensis]